MKRNFLLKLLCALLVATTVQATAQEQKATWGGDVNVNPVAGRYYKNARVSVAYDGTIYVGRLYATAAAAPYDHWEVLKSTDTGHTFTGFDSSFATAGQQYRAFDILAAGANATDFKLIVARSFYDSSAANLGDNRLLVYAYGASGQYLSTLVDESHNYIASFYRGWEAISLSSDWREKNSISAPYEIDIVAQKSGVDDSIIVWASKDAGATMTRRGLYGTPRYIKTVSSSIGSTLSTTSLYGRFGIVWDEFVNNGDMWGKIYGEFLYADDASDPGINTGLQTIAGSDNFRNPVIVMSQQTGTVVGPGADDIRTMIIAENNLLVPGVSSITCNVSDSMINGVAAFNTPATVKLGSAAGGAYDAHGVYDPVANNFLITYYDSATQALVYDVKPLSASIAALPTVIKANYRDAATDLGLPAYPRTDINMVNDKAVFVWNDNSKTMFDAEYAQNVSVQSVPVNVTDVQVFPNPANDVINLGFIAKQNGSATVAVLDVTGRQVLSMQADVMVGVNRITVALGALSAGNYFIQVKGEVASFNARFTKN